MRIREIGNTRTAGKVLVEDHDGSRYFMDPDRVKELRPRARILSWADGTDYKAREAFNPEPVEGADIPDQPPIEVQMYDAHGNGALDGLEAARSLAAEQARPPAEGDSNDTGSHQADDSDSGQSPASSGSESGPGNKKSAKDRGGSDT